MLSALNLAVVENIENSKDTKGCQNILASEKFGIRISKGPKGSKKRKSTTLFSNRNRAHHDECVHIPQSPMPKPNLCGYFFLLIRDFDFLKRCVSRVFFLIGSWGGGSGSVQIKKNLFFSREGNPTVKVHKKSKSNQ